MQGLRFGLASAVLSSVVLVLSLRPIHRFRVALVASLLTIAVVDSMADAYALFNAAGDLASAGASIVAKLVVCGSLAILAYFAGRAGSRRRGSGSSAPGSVETPASRRAQLLLYAVVAAFVAGQLLLTVLTSESGEGFKDVALLAGMFVGAVALSLAMNRLVSRLEH